MSTQFGPFQDATLENLIELGQTLATQVEKMTRLQVETGLESSREAMAATQALLAVKDPKGPPAGRPPICSRISTAPPTPPASSTRC